MKRFFIILLLGMVAYHTALTQNVSINTSGNPAHESAILDVSSNNKGVLVPRMAPWERLNISNPAQGLLVYDTGSRSFWFYDGGWIELAGGGGLPTGPAGGDLSGNYPTPNVVKLQNLDVASDFPLDKQVLKWDVLANNWKGRNDSLFLPYNATFSNNGNALFGITTNSSTNGSSALYGKRGGAGSGIVPGSTMGVWGDNSNGLGVVGTSNTGVGTYGFSFGNHGVYGYSTVPGFAGVAGSNAAEGGIGVLGESSEDGFAVVGRNWGDNGKAALFEITSSSNADTAVIVQNAGLGLAALFTSSFSDNSQPIVEVSGGARGDGIYSELLNPGNINNANFRGTNYSPGGYVFYGQSEMGKSCYLYNTGAANTNYTLDVKTAGLASASNFNISNPSNTNPILIGYSNGLGGGLSLSLTNVSSTGTGINLTHSGTGNGFVSTVSKGKAAVFSNTSSASTNDVLEVTNIGTQNAATFTTSNASNFESTVSVSTNGTGYGLEALVSNVGSTAPAVYAVSLGSTGIAGYGVTTAVFGHSTSPTNGIGVLGQTTIANPNGIGVKGISSSTVFTSGAVTGISNANGVAVYGESTAGGIGVYGKTSRVNGAAVYGTNDASQGQGLRGNATGNEGIGVYGEAGNASSHSIAAYFRNNNSTNPKNVTHIQSNGTGKSMHIENTNVTQSADLIYAKNNGTGNFLRLVDDGGNTITNVSNGGNIITDGAVTVKSNKGIVRNSSATQLRTEILEATFAAGSLTHYDEFNSSETAAITFATPFSSAPAVFLGDLKSGGMAGLTITIEDVTTTGCTVVASNYTPYDFTFPASTYSIIAIGPE